jgi:hypothetical protein
MKANPNLSGLCPLCGQFFPRSLLHHHIITERPEKRQHVMDKIKASHPGWRHELGACPNCWESYRNLSGAAAAAEASRSFQVASESPLNDRTAYESSL